MIDYVHDNLNKSIFGLTIFLHNLNIITND